MGKVIVFGSMNMDLSIESARMPEAGETIAGSGFLTNPGGKGANQAVACARLGAPTTMLAAVGADAFGDELVRGLEAAGVDCARVVRSKCESTGVAVILRSGGDNRIVLHAGANHALGAEEATTALKGCAEPGDVLVCQGECAWEATRAVMHAARELGLWVLFNPAPARAVEPEVWADVDLVCLNETECEVVCGVLPADAASAREACERLRALGAGEVVVTMGGSGSAGMGADGRLVEVPARAAGPVVDTTAAGDTFIGALAAGHLRGLSLAEAMAWGSAAAGITVTRLGAQQAIPTAAEVAAVVGGSAAAEGDGPGARVAEAGQEG